MNKADLHNQLRKLSEQYYTASLEDRDAILIIIENLLKDQLAIQPQNTELWLKLAMLEYAPTREDPDIIASYLDKILEYDPYNADAHIIKAYMYCMLTPKIPDKILKELCDIKISEPEKAAMREIIKAWHYDDINLYVECLLTAIKFAPSFATPYLTLGKFYIHNNQPEEGRKFLTLGITNIKHVYSDDDPAGDITDVEEFYNEHLRGVHVTRYKFDDLMKLL